MLVKFLENFSLVCFLAQSLETVLLYVVKSDKRIIHLVQYTAPLERRDLPTAQHEHIFFSLKFLRKKFTGVLVGENAYAEY